MGIPLKSYVNFYCVKVLKSGEVRFKLENPFMLVCFVQVLKSGEERFKFDEENPFVDADEEGEVSSDLKIPQKSPVKQNNITPAVIYIYVLTL